MERKFGRMVQFDEHSREYPIRELLPSVAVPRSYTWSCGINLDQGSEPACTGFAVSHEAAARPCVVSGVTNKIALELYHRAQQLDEWPGEDYAGSSVLGAMKAGRERRWYGEYRWAFSIDDLILAIGYHGPAVLGICWYEGMSDPDANGLIAPTGDLLGGHAILCNGYNAKSKLFRLHNSWGKSWGKNGECFISCANLARLLKDEGEACIPVKRLRG